MIDTNETFVVLKYNTSPIPLWADLYTIPEFYSLVRTGVLSSDDGSGFAATKQFLTNLCIFDNNDVILPNDILSEFTHVVWFSNYEN